MRLESCKHFDSEEFIKNLKKWRKEKEKYVEQLEALSELPAFDNKSGVRSSGISDPTANQTMDRLRLEFEIEDIEWCEEAYRYGLSKLSEEERELLLMFFEPKKPIWREIEDYTEKNFISRMTTYTRRREVIRKLNSIIEERFF